jgi:carbonic anhydrase
MTRKRIPTSTVLLALVALAFAAPVAAQESVEWSYEGPTGPANWASLSPAFRTCGEGSRQSPIDLRDAARRPAERIRVSYTPSGVSQLNNGETVEVRSELAQTLHVGDKPYSLVQFHFHSPAEHPIAGAVEPLEIHFVHQAADGERAVLGALVSIGRQNREFELLAQAFPHSAGEETRVETPVDLLQLMPASRRAYRYPGSLTTPPCTEGIRWMVLAKPIRISEHQLEELHETVEGNARPAQPRNGRPLTLF